MEKDVFVVTGSSKGIGKALVEQLLQRPNIQVIGLSRSKSDILHERFEEKLVDLSDLEALNLIYQSIFPDLTGVSKVVLVNNAGWIGPIAHIGKLEVQDIEKIFRVNTIAPLLLMDAFVRKYGAQSNLQKLVVNISSGAASKAIDGWSTYSASKAAVQMMSQTAQKEADLDGTGIRYFSVAPGVVDTDMQADIRAADLSDFSALERFRSLKEGSQLSSPEEAGEKILFLIDHPNKFQEVVQDVRNFNL